MVRPLREADADAFARLRLNGLQLFPEAFGAAYEDGLDMEKTRENLASKNEEDFILGAFKGKVMAGIAGFVRYKGHKSRHKGLVWGMYVEPGHAGQGIGRALLKACIEKACSLPGLEQIHLSVTSGSKPARLLYESLGFQVWGTERESLKIGDKYVDEIYMVKWVASG